MKGEDDTGIWLILLSRKFLLVMCWGKKKVEPKGYYVVTTGKK